MEEKNNNLRKHTPQTTPSRKPIQTPTEMHLTRPDTKGTKEERVKKNNKPRTSNPDPTKKPERPLKLQPAEQNTGLGQKHDLKPTAPPPVPGKQERNK